MPGHKLRRKSSKLEKKHDRAPFEYTASAISLHMSFPCPSGLGSFGDGGTNSSSYNMITSTKQK
eukprot:4228380-Amphidinium_carterae.1